MAERLEGKVALITGGGSGIGDATAHLFASEGAKVVVADLKIDAAKNVADAVVSDGGDAVALAGDVAARADCEAMVAGTVEQYGRIDVLINSAGVTPRYAPAEWDWEQKWDWTIGINLKGSMMMSYFAVEQMKEQGSGSIVNMASVIGLVGYADGMSDGFHPYPHSKGGVVQMTRELSTEWASRGVRVNAIVLAQVMNPDLRRRIDKDPRMEEQWLRGLAMGRLGEPDDVKGVAIFLASDAAANITGQALNTDRGELFA